MTRGSLRVRDTQLRELMDDPDCDLAGLRHTYAQFRVVNRLVAGWRRVYRQRIRPLLRTGQTTTLLDIGSGGGDVARTLARWARRDGFALAVTAIAERPWYMDAMGMSQPLHFGDYGGMPMKILWAVLDVLTIIVLGSGVYLWLVRRKAAKS